MFAFLNEDTEKLYGDEEDTISQHFYEFNLSLDDYFLNRKLEWDLFEAKMFVFEVNGKRIGVPSGFYIMVGDVLGAVDWIQVDELIGRDLDVLVMSEGFTSWSLSRMELVDEDDQYEFYWPVTKNVIPISPVDDEFSILVSKVDRYIDTKDKTVDVFATF